MVQNPQAYRIGRFSRKINTKEVFNIAQLGRPLHDNFMPGNTVDLEWHGITFIVDFADQYFQQVFECYDSPYNTYRYWGLPPGPIANPGAASLDAAVDPLESSELYFVAKPGGGHAFSQNLAQHNRAVSRWRAYLRSSR